MFSGSQVNTYDAIIAVVFPGFLLRGSAESIAAQEEPEADEGGVMTLPGGGHVQTRPCHEGRVQPHTSLPARAAERPVLAHVDRANRPLLPKQPKAQ